MVFIPPVQHGSTKPQTPAQTLHDSRVGMLIVALIFLGIALVIFVVAPHTKSPPPAAMPWVVLGIAALFGVLSFVFWLREQRDALGGTDEPGRKES